MKAALSVEKLSFSFNSHQPVLRGVTFAVFEGECVGIVGANGAGKSTLLWCLLGLHKATGTVRVFGERLTKTHLSRIGVVFQNPEDQLFMPALLQDLMLPLVNSGVPAEEASVRAHDALAQVGLEDAVFRPASQLSLGERKRACIAASLVFSPELLLLDEPTAELDGRSVRQLAALLRTLPIARLITSHHLEFLRELCSRMLVLHHGEIIAEGSTEEILQNSELLERAGLI